MINKSSAYSSKHCFFSRFFINDVEIPKSNGLIYLGLPIGDVKFTEEFFNEKMSKVEKSLHSLRTLGCK